MAIVITDEDAQRLLTMQDYVDAMRICFKDFANGAAISLPRARYTIPNGVADQSYYANVHIGACPTFGMACVRAGTHIVDDTAYNSGRRSFRNPEPQNWAVIILYDIQTSEPLAFMHESHISGMRVGATTAVAVDAIARDNAATLSILGTGRQGRAHAAAICSVRPVKKIRVFSPNPIHVDNFRRSLEYLGVEIIVCEDERETIESSDIICCATNTTTPVLKGAWLSPGQMIISIANSDQTIERREVDHQVFARADNIVLNDWESVKVNNQVELLECIEDGTVLMEDLSLLGDIIAKKKLVKSTSDNIVYYKSNTGLAMQFAAVGSIIYQRLLKEGTNRIIPREWLAAGQYGIG